MSYGLKVLRPGQGAPRKAIVFVHGILSSHRTFESLIAAMRGDQRLDDWALVALDYDWGEAIRQNAAILRRALLDQRFEDVTLIGHSMGGLVSRFAVIDGPPVARGRLGTPSLPCVKRIVMLGTPNFGALTAAQVGMLMQEAMRLVGVTPVFPRKRGLLDLTRIQALYLEIVKFTSNAPPPRAENVEYVTIPGIFYHLARPASETLDGRRTTVFGALARFFTLLSTFPPIHVTLPRPNDGIVPVSSVALLPQAGSVCEKSHIATPVPLKQTYRHVEPLTMYDCGHMDIQSDEKTGQLIRDLIAAGSFGAWESGLSADDRRATKIMP